MAKINPDKQATINIRPVSLDKAIAEKPRQPNIAVVKVLAKEQRLAAALQRNLLRRKQQE